MAPVIERDCRADIGGDEQRVHSVDTRYSRHDVQAGAAAGVDRRLPARRQACQVLVNARTGEVVGERPYSAAKITAAVVAALLVITALVLLYLQYKKH